VRGFLQKLQFEFERLSDVDYDEEEELEANHEDHFISEESKGSSFSDARARSLNISQFINNYEHDRSGDVELRHNDYRSNFVDVEHSQNSSDLAMNRRIDSEHHEEEKNDQNDSLVVESFRHSQSRRTEHNDNNEDFQI